METATVAKRSLSQIQPINTKRQEIAGPSSAGAKSEKQEKDKRQHSKVGRKPLNTEAPNKRIAQNRAAQRAFQERKERKMKNLEEKVQELEKLNKVASTEAEFLRLQVQILSNELSKFKNSTSYNNTLPASSPLTSAIQRADVLFTDKGKDMSLPWSTMNFDVNNSSPNTSSHYNSTSTKSDKNYNSSTSPNSDLDTSTEQYVSIVKTIPPVTNDNVKTSMGTTATANTTSASKDFDEQSFCSQLNMACGTKEQPVPLILQHAHENGVILKSSVKNYQQPQANNSSNSKTSSGNLSAQLRPTASVSSNSSTFSGASPMSSDLFGINGFSSNSNNNNNSNKVDKMNDFGITLINDAPFMDHKESLFEDTLSKPKMSLFGDNTFEANKFLDGLDFLKDSETFRDTVPEEVALFNETELSNENFQNDMGLDDVNFDDFLVSDSFPFPGNVVPSTNETSKINHNATEGDESLFKVKNDDDDDDAVVPAKETGMMKCSEIWDRLTSHVKYTEIDIDGLCDELRTKAKCSDKGALVAAADFEKTMMRNLNQ